MFYYVSMLSRRAKPPIRYVRISMARAQYRFDHFYLTRPLSALSHVFHLFSSICLAPMDGRAPLPSRNALLFIFSSTKKASTVIGTGFQAGDPREIRTPDTLIRSQVLYPAELLGHVAGAEGLKPPTYGFGDRCSINCAMPLSV